MTVLDVSDVGLAKARRRLGDRAGRVRWVVADLLSWQPARRVRVWHDRAVFHFLIDPADQARYHELLDAALEPGAAVVVGTFAADGPDRCSGLPTSRYSPEQLSTALGASVEPVMSRPSCIGLRPRTFSRSPGSPLVTLAPPGCSPDRIPLDTLIRAGWCV